MNYRDELYKSIIVNAIKANGITPLRDEAKELGVNMNYIKKKYGCYEKFIKSMKLKRRIRSYETVMKYITPNEETVKYVLFDMNTKEVLMIDLMSKIASCIDYKKEYITYRFVDRSIIKSRYYVFHKFNFEIFKLCEFDFKKYRDVMFYKYDKNYFRKDKPRMYNHAIEIKNKIDTGKLKLNELIDVDIFDKIIENDKNE